MLVAAVLAVSGRPNWPESLAIAKEQLRIYLFILTLDPTLVCVYSRAK